MTLDEISGLIDKLEKPDPQFVYGGQQEALQNYMIPTQVYDAAKAHFDAQNFANRRNLEIQILRQIVSLIAEIQSTHA